MILRGDTPRGLSRTGLFATVALALLLLPLRPSFARQSPKADDVKPEAETTKTEPTVTKVEPTTTQVEPTVTQVPATTTRRAGVQEDLDDAAEELTRRYSSYKARLTAAQLVQKRAEELNKKGVISREEVEKATTDVLILQAEIDGQEAKAKAEAEGRRLAAKEAIDVLKSQLKTREAAVQKAKARRQLAMTEVEKFARLEAKGRGFVAPSEKAKADAGIAVVDAEIAVAEAEAAEVQVKLNHAIERAPVQPPRVTAIERKAFTPRTDDAAKRLDELDAKLDRLLAEIDSTRKVQTPKMLPIVRVRHASLRPKTTKDLLELLKKMESEKLSNEEVTRRLYSILFEREPTPEEMQETASELSGTTAPRGALPQIVMNLAPPWSPDTTEEFLPKLVNREPENTAEVVYRAILDRAPTPAEVDRFASELPFSTDRLETLRQLVGDVINLRKEVLKSDISPEDLRPVGR